MYDIKVMLLASGGTTDSNAAPFYTAIQYNNYAKYLSSLAGRFKNNSTLFAYDLYNEPGIHNPKDLNLLGKDSICKMTGIWYDSIKYYAPNQLVTIGDEGSPDVELWDPGVMHLDFVCFHPYPKITNDLDTNNINQGVNQVLSEIYWYGNNVNMPWMLGETGFASLPRSDPNFQYVDGTDTNFGKFITQTLHQIKACGGNGCLYWEYGSIPWFGPIEENYALMNSSNIAKTPAVNAIKSFNPNTAVSSGLPPPNYYNYYNYIDNFPNSPTTGTVKDQFGNPVKGAVVFGWYGWAAGTETFSFTKSDGSFNLYWNTNLHIIPLGAPNLVYGSAITAAQISTIYGPSGGPFNLIDTLAFSPFLGSFDATFGTFTISWPLNFAVYDSITTTSGDAFTVTTSANATLEAGHSITLEPGFDAQSTSGLTFDAKYGLPIYSCSSYPNHRASKGGGGSSNGKATKNEISNSASIVSFLLKEPGLVSELISPTTHVSPNPTLDGQPSVYISNPADFSEITVTNLLGEVVQHINNLTSCNKLNISANARGIYIVKVSGQKNVFITKIIYE